MERLVIQPPHVFVCPDCKQCYPCSYRVQTGTCFRCQPDPPFLSLLLVPIPSVDPHAHLYAQRRR